MCTAPILQQVLENQQTNGAFKSIIKQNNQQCSDANACITVLVLRELLKKPGLVPTEVIDKALNFLKSCASVSNKGGYNFYPVQTSTQNILQLPDDADDTALITLMLLQTGQVSRQIVIKDTCVLLDKYRVVTTDRFQPAWIKKGAFYTWMNAIGVNVVDCCVNANIAALYAYAGLQHLRGYAEACTMITEAVRWAGRCNKRLLSLTPFYAAPQELYFVVEHAVAMGAVTLTHTLNMLEWIKPTKSIVDPARPIFCSAYGLVTWYCSLLQQLRYLPSEGTII